MVDPVPEHLRTITPRLVVSDAAEAIEFYKKAFGAKEIGERYSLDNGAVVQAEIRIGDSVLFIKDESEDGQGGASPTSLGNVTAIIALAVADVDNWWERAVAAGAEVIHPLADQFYGDRGGRLEDPFGQQWMLSTHIEDVSPDEFDRRMRQMQEGG